MKKIISIIMAMVMLMSFCVFANAENAEHSLQFNKDGKFTILHIADCQDVYPAKEEMFTYINYMLKTYKPDLVVLGGDNDVSAQEYKEKGIEALVKPFVENETYFTLVFGNHDHQQGYTNAQLFDMYVKYGGEYFLGTDTVDSQYFEKDYKFAKSGTQFLPVYSSADSSKAAFGLYMFDSGSYVFDENGNELGYNSVEPYQIDWYKSVREENGKDGAYLPSIAFQHIVVGDVYKELYYSSAVSLGDLGKEFYGNDYTFVPKTQNFDGFLSEAPCPGYYNYGQLNALAEKGDIQAVFSGHDHTNSYDVVVNGVHVINTPGITYYSYSSELNHGARLITLDEKTASFTSEVITVNSIAAQNAEYAKSINKSQFVAKLYEVLADVLQNIAKALSVFGKVFDLIGVK